MLDLYHATRDDLIRLILGQRDEVAALRELQAAREREIAELRQAVGLLTTRVGELTAALAAAQAGDEGPPPSRSSPSGVPGIKPEQAPDRADLPRKRRTTGAGRKRMQATEQVVHALAACPDCGTPLAGGSVKRTRDVIELPPVQVVVTAHVYLERQCPECGKRCTPRPELAGVVTGQGRIGHRLTSLIALLREEARLPVRTIQSLLQTIAGLDLSLGSIVAASRRLAARADPVVEAITEAVRASPVVHLDETGWREDGRNGYLWTASTPTERLFVHGNRAKRMVDRILGDQFAGVVVSDFYVAYTTDERMHQYCWAHLLRDIHELVARHPADPVLGGWADAVAGVFARAQAGVPGTARERWALRIALQTDLNQLCLPWAQVEVPHRGLCARMRKHLESLFVFVTEPAVPATNNAAERSLRHLVVIRKISGGTRSARGTATRMTLASLFGTWRAQGKNPFQESYALLASPHL
jgi:transposase